MSSTDNKYLNKIQEILSAIEDKRYKSRTIKGIARSTSTPEPKVMELLKSDPNLKQKVMVVPGLKKNDQTLYTTVVRYKNETPLSIRVFNLMKKRSMQDE